MKKRNELIEEVRGNAIGDITDVSTGDEAFQNRILRPILEFQNDLFVDVFRNYLTKHKTDFHSFPVEKKLQFIENSIHKDVKFRNALKGMIIGWFTSNDFQYYIGNSSNLNKRMMNMLIEQLKSQVLLFEN